MRLPLTDLAIECQCVTHLSASQSRQELDPRIEEPSANILDPEAIIRDGSPCIYETELNFMDGLLSELFDLLFSVLPPALYALRGRNDLKLTGPEIR
jgi:hypothetical protein